MKLEKPIVKIATLIFLCLLAALFLVAFPLFLTLELDSQNHTFLNELSVKNAEAIGYKFKEQNNLFDTLVDRIDPIYYTSPSDAVKSIGKIKTQIEYDFYGVATRDGEICTSRGTNIVVEDTSLIEKGLNSSGLLFERVSGKDNSDDDYFIMIEPLFDKNHRTNSVFFVLFNEHDVRSNFKSAAFNSKEIFMIVDKKGNNIVSTSILEQYAVVNNVFTEDIHSDKNREKRIETIKNDMKLNKSGIVLSSIDPPLFLYYAPINYNDWYLFSLVSADTVNSTRNTVLAYVISMCLFLFVVFILFATYIISSERSKKENFDKILYTDSVTGGPSYAKFCIDVKTQLMKVKGKYAYIVMDIDSFKFINTCYGYDKGDEIIKLVYSLWKNSLNENEYVSRFGPDVFAVLMQYTSEEQLLKRIDDFCSRCKEYSDEDMAEYSLTPSIGIYIINDNDIDIHKYQNGALIAKTLVKGDLSKLYAIYTSDIEKNMTDKKFLEEKLSRAIKEEALSVYFQPQYDAATKKICGAEALLRWKDKNGNFQSPAQFIPLAEERGIIKQLDRHAFKKACLAQKYLSDLGLPDIDISVNVSQQSLYDKSFADTYLDIIKSTGADIKRIQLEITETSLFENTKTFIKIIKRLKKFGFKILMDDFGTGYSSLVMIKHIPIDYLKLDKSIMDEYNSSKGRAIIDCILTMAKKLNIVVIAEGIETQEQFDFAKSEHCDIVQGYYFSKAVDLYSFEKLLGNQ